MHDLWIVSVHHYHKMCRSLPKNILNIGNSKIYGGCAIRRIMSNLAVAEVTWGLIHLEFPMDVFSVLKIIKTWEIPDGSDDQYECERCN